MGRGAFKRIKPGEPQLLPCIDCGMAGYKFNDYLGANYEVTMNANGEIEQEGFIERHNKINAGISVFCANCGNRLKFRLERNFFAPSFFELKTKAKT